MSPLVKAIYRFVLSGPEDDRTKESWAVWTKAAIKAKIHKYRTIEEKREAVLKQLIKMLIKKESGG